MFEFLASIKSVHLLTGLRFLVALHIRNGKPFSGEHKVCQKNKNCKKCKSGNRLNDERKESSRRVATFTHV